MCSCRQKSPGLVDGSASMVIGILEGLLRFHLCTSALAAFLDVEKPTHFTTYMQVSPAMEEKEEARVPSCVMLSKGEESLAIRERDDGSPLVRPRIREFVAQWAHGNHVDIVQLV